MIAASLTGLCADRPNRLVQRVKLDRFEFVGAFQAAHGRSDRAVVAHFHTAAFVDNASEKERAIRNPNPEASFSGRHVLHIGAVLSILAIPPRHGEDGQCRQNQEGDCCRLWNCGAGRAVAAIRTSELSHPRCEIVGVDVPVSIGIAIA